MLLMADAEAEPAAGGLQQRFEGKTVLITGAGGELGREGAVYFATHGANVIALDLGAAALGQTLAAVRSANPEAKCVTAACDVCDRASVQAAVKAGVAAFGCIDLCWNNAGVQGAMVPTLDYPPADFEQTLQVNVVGAFHVLQAVGGAMRESGGGAIVNTASAAALRGTPTMVAYVASKAAISPYLPTYLPTMVAYVASKAAPRDSAPLPSRPRPLSPPSPSPLLALS